MGVRLCGAAPSPPHLLLDAGLQQHLLVADDDVLHSALVTGAVYRLSAVILHAEVRVHIQGVDVEADREPAEGPDQGGHMPGRHWKGKHLRGPRSGGTIPVTCCWNARIAPLSTLLVPCHEGKVFLVGESGTVVTGAGHPFHVSAGSASHAVIPSLFTSATCLQVHFELETFPVGSCLPVSIKCGGTAIMSVPLLTTAAFCPRGISPASADDPEIRRVLSTTDVCCSSERFAGWCLRCNTLDCVSYNHASRRWRPDCPSPCGGDNYQDESLSTGRAGVVAIKTEYVPVGQLVLPGICICFV